MATSELTVYRPEIDGLRAIAVLAVVVNHTFPDVLPGGFVGVDIFFVISGFLITRILLSDMAAGKFSILSFYAARARRILPALIFMLLVVTIFVAMTFSVLDLRAYAKSLISTAIFTANFHFYGESGYFAPDAKTLPLLHMWSLAVEEQFYLIFPFLLLVSFRAKKTPLLFMFGFIVSLGATEIVIPYAQQAAFYFPIFRAWEFAVGCMLAVGQLNLRASTKHLLSIIGLLAIVASFVLLNDRVSFPGLTALPACLGAAFIILGASNSIVGAILKLRPVATIGLISYSLYLWHWPILVIGSYVEAAELSITERIIALFVSFVMSAISWKWVEQPFRRCRSSSGAGLSLFPASGALLATILLGAGITSVVDRPALVSMFYDETVIDLVVAAKSTVTSSNCRGSENAVADVECRIGDPSLPASIALWGDSYADSLKPSVSSILKGRSAFGFILHACPAILGTYRIDNRLGWRDFGEVCQRHNLHVVDQLSQNNSIKTVIMFSSLRSAMLPDQQPVRLIASGMEGVSKEQMRMAIASNLIETANTLRGFGKTVIIVGGYFADERLSAHHLLRIYRGDRSIFDDAVISESEYEAMTGPLNSYLRSKSQGDIIFVDPKTIFCKPEAANCSYYDQTPLLKDETHLTTEGARRLSYMIKAALDERGIAY